MSGQDALRILGWCAHGEWWRAVFVLCSDGGSDPGSYLLIQNNLHPSFSYISIVFLHPPPSSLSRLQQTHSLEPPPWTAGLHIALSAAILRLFSALNSQNSQSCGERQSASQH